MNEVKPIWKSKTFWFAILFAVVNVAGVLGYQTYQPDAQTTEIVGVLVSIAVIALRYVTREPVK